MFSYAAVLCIISLTQAQRHVVRSDHAQYFIQEEYQCYNQFFYLRVCTRIDKVRVCRFIKESPYDCYEREYDRYHKTILSAPYCPYLFKQRVDGVSKLYGVCNEGCSLCFCYYGLQLLATVRDEDLKPDRDDEESEEEDEQNTNREHNGIVTESSVQTSTGIDDTFLPEPTTKKNSQDNKFDSPEYLDKPKKDKKLEKLVENQSITFTMKLLKSLRYETPGENILVSPPSMMAILKILLGAAEGETKRELQELLGEPYDIHNFEITEGPHLSLDIKTALIFDDDYRGRASKVRELNKLDVSTETLDFDSPELAARRLNERIRGKGNAFEPDDLQDTDMVILNSLTFSGSFEKPFLNETPKLEFTEYDGTRVVALMMQGKQDETYNVAFSSKLNATVIELPYKSGSMVMKVILPNEDVQLEEVEDHLDVEAFEEIEKNLQPEKLTLLMPKVELNYKHDFKATLMKMGLHNTFRDAEFPGFFPEPRFERYLLLSQLIRSPFKVGSLLHSASMNITEDGTTVSADTTQVVSLIAPDRLIINRPFLVFIEDKKSKQMLFVSRIGK